MNFSKENKKTKQEMENVRRISKSLNEYQIQGDNNNESFQKKIPNQNQKGLFANSILENIKENSNGLNNLDLQKELQVDFYHTFF